MTSRIRITRVADGDDIARQLLPHMEQLGQAIGARMQRLVPKRTWALHDTVMTITERQGTKVTTTVGVGNEDVDYPIHVEKGTSRSAAQPFMRPALEQSGSRDLNYSGRGIIQHGVRAVATRRTRVRDRAKK